MVSSNTVFGKSRTLLTLLTFILSFCSGTIVKAYDFSNLGGDTESNRIEKRNLTNDVRTIRRGSAPDLKQFEVEELAGKLLWVGIGNRTIHLSRGGRPRLSNGTLQEEADGSILMADLRTLEDSRALLSVVFRSYTGLDSTMYVLTSEGKDLTLEEIDYKEGVALRLLRSHLYGQSFTTNAFWNGPIHRYQPGEEGYKRTDPINLPVQKARLLSSARIKENRWTTIDPSGDLFLVSPSNVLQKIEGNYGATDVTFSSERANTRRPERSENLKLAPIYSSDQNLLAVARNPSSSSGFLSMFSGNSSGERAVLSFFKHRNDRLRETATAGPLDGRVVDLHVSRANERQILWLRKLENGSYRLEMLDFSD